MVELLDITRIAVNGRVSVCFVLTACDILETVRKWTPSASLEKEGFIIILSNKTGKEKKYKLCKLPNSVISFT